MLMDIKCSAVASVAVKLTFDDHTVKDRLISMDDLVDITYNSSGIIKHIIGKVISISVAGSDQRDWYIIVDGSDDFQAVKSRIGVLSILDCEIIFKASTTERVRTPLGDHGMPYIRIMNGVIQYSQDGGMTWRGVKIHDKDVIEDEEGTVPEKPTNATNDTTAPNEDVIKDEVY